MLGLIGLFLATASVQSWTWSIPFEPWPSHYDIWGIRILDGFFQFRLLAQNFLLIASFLYPILVWMSTSSSRTPEPMKKVEQMVAPKHMRASPFHFRTSTNTFRFLYPKRPANPNRVGLVVLSGLLLPGVFIFGQPFGDSIFESTAIEFGLTGIVTPIYTFFFTTIFHVGARVDLSFLPSPWPFIPSPLLELSLIFFGLGILQILFLRFYLRQRISVKYFLLPILISLAMSLFIFLNNLTMSWTLTSRYIEGFTVMAFPLPVLTIGVLIRATQKVNTSEMVPT